MRILPPSVHLVPEVPCEGGEPGLRFGIILARAYKDTYAPRPVGLLRTRGKRRESHPTK
jgi:hypothetical protein